jgi:hypothetical protein
VREPIISDSQFTWAQLDTEAAFRSEQRSFHIFAEAYADLRGEILNLREDEVFSPADDAVSERVLVLTGLSGTLEARLAGRLLRLKPLSQLLVLPGVPIHLRALCDASVQVISLLGLRPQVEGKPSAGR